MIVGIVLLLAVGMMATPVSATQESDCGVDGCLEAPDNKPDYIPGGGVAFDTPVVDTEGVMPGDRVTVNDDFQAFLKAKKAFDADNGIIV